jgi:arylsulfatase
MNDSLPPPDSTTYYTTDAFTDYAIKFIAEQEDTNPFILYLAYNAPHWPLHAKPEDIRKFVGKYLAGWDEIRKQRFQRQLEIGLFDSELGLSERDSRVRPWAEVDSVQKMRADYRMAVYAAQVYCMDYNIGRLLKVLEERGNLDNTLIIFLSDNGACAESYDEFGSKDDSFINRATFSGAVSYGIGWANVSNTPLFEYKVKSYEGGISAPLIVHWPARMKTPGGAINHTPVQLIDIMPTILDAAGAEYPETFHGGNAIFPIEGHSLTGSPTGKKIKGHEWMFWEHSGFCAVRHEDLKAYKKLEDTVWQLYNLANDRMESHDISGDYPEIVREMSSKWYDWANSHRVLPKRAAEKQ